MLCRAAPLPKELWPRLPLWNKSNSLLIEAASQRLHGRDSGGGHSSTPLQIKLIGVVTLQPTTLVFLFCAQLPLQEDHTSVDH